MADAKETVVLGQTLGGKNIVWVRAGRVPTIHLEGGGELPKELQGGWTDQTKAQSAVASYLAKAQAELDKKKTNSRSKTA